ncbi:MAG TPA: hypothetical protein VGK99_18665 [Acidobacteriota bacterium]|jgi:hypothetical protein
MTEVLKPEDRQVRIEKEGEWSIRIVSYKLGPNYICTVDNVDPGANLARSEAPSREEAESAAISKARHMIGKTRTSR